MALIAPNPDPSTELFPLLSLLIPVRNEAESVASVAAELTTVLHASPFTWEAIWIDDGSTDGTLAALSALIAPHRVIRLQCNLGQSAALFAGFAAARGIWIGTLDGDGQNDPADLIRQLTHALNHDLGMCNGIRARRNDSWVRKLSSRVGNGFRNWLTRETQVRDVGCSTRVMRRELAVRLPFFHGAHRFLPTLVRMQGGRMDQIAVNHRPRAAGKSKYGVWNRLWTGLRDCFGVRWLQDRQRQWQVEEMTGKTYEQPVRDKNNLRPQIIESPLCQ